MALGFTRIAASAQLARVSQLDAGLRRAPRVRQMRRGQPAARTRSLRPVRTIWCPAVRNAGTLISATTPDDYHNHPPKENFQSRRQASYVTASTTKSCQAQQRAWVSSNGGTIGGQARFLPIHTE